MPPSPRLRQLHFVERPVLRQRITELDTESLLGGTQDNVPHIVARLLRFHQQRADIRERRLYVRLREELPILPARVLAVELVRLPQEPRVDAAHHGAGTHTHQSRRRSRRRNCPTAAPSSLREVDEAGESQGMALHIASRSRSRLRTTWGPARKARSGPRWSPSREDMVPVSGIGLARWPDIPPHGEVA